MPSIKVLENNKSGSPESIHNAIESGGNEGFNSIKETQQTTNPAVVNNGNTKDQPANPLQQIILIIEHKIRNLEKRKVWLFFKFDSIFLFLFSSEDD